MGKRVAQTEIQAAAEDIDHDGLLFLQIKRNRSQDFGTGLFQRVGIRNSGHGRIVADPASTRRGSHKSVDGGFADSIDGGRWCLISYLERFGFHGFSDYLL